MPGNLKIPAINVIIVTCLEIKKKRKRWILKLGLCDSLLERGVIVTSIFQLFTAKSAGFFNR